MIIRIKEGRAESGQKPVNFFIPLPNILLSPTALTLLAPAICGVLRCSGSDIQLTAAQLREIAVALRAWRRTSPDTTLVEVTSANGDEVRIRL